MARIRSIKPEFWTDLRLARLSRDARLLYVALWNQADEWARLHADVRYVKGHCLPYDDDLSLAAIDGLLAELEAAGRVRRYVADGQPFLVLPKFGKHQRLEPHKVPSRLPAPPEEGSDPPPTGSDLPVWASYDSRAFLSAPDADSSETICALQVAGGREQGAGSRGNYLDQKSKLGRKPATTTDPLFDEFWSAYPLRVAKAAARRAWAKALREASADTITTAARRYADDPTRTFTAHPATWLNAGRWDDEGPAGQLSVVRSRTEQQDDVLRDAMARAQAADKPTRNQPELTA